MFIKRRKNKRNAVETLIITSFYLIYCIISTHKK